MAALGALVAQTGALRRHQKQRRGADMGGGGSEKPLRLTLYRFGEHLRHGSVGTGKLILLSPSAAWTTVLGLFLRHLYGHGTDLSAIDETRVHVYLLPSGEEVVATELLQSNDRLVVFLDDDGAGFRGSLLDEESVIEAIPKVERVVERMVGSIVSHKPRPATPPDVRVRTRRRSIAEVRANLGLAADDNFDVGHLEEGDDAGVDEIDGRLEHSTRSAGSDAEDGWMSDGSREGDGGSGGGGGGGTGAGGVESRKRGATGRGGGDSDAGSTASATTQRSNGTRGGGSAEFLAPLRGTRDTDGETKETKDGVEEDDEPGRPPIASGIPPKSFPVAADNSTPASTEGDVKEFDADDDLKYSKTSPTPLSAPPIPISETEAETLRKQEIRRKFRMAVRRLVGIYRFQQEQAPVLPRGISFASNRGEDGDGAGAGAGGRGSGSGEYLESPGGIPRYGSERSCGTTEDSLGGGLKRASSIARKRWRGSLSHALGLTRHQNMKSIDAYVREQSNIYQYSEHRKGGTDETLPPLIIHPEGSFRISWDVLILLLVVFFGFVVPFRIGFDVKLSKPEEAFDIFADIIFIIDIFINFRTAYRDDGVLVTDPVKIRNAYLSSWFPLDFVATFPMHWFASTGGFNRLFRLIRLFKLFRMLRLLKLFPRLFTMLETSIKFNPSMIRFIRSFAVMFLMWHTIGCAYWYVSRTEYNGVRKCTTPSGETNECFVNHCVCDLDHPEEITVFSDTDPNWYREDYPDLWVPHYAIIQTPIEQQYAIAIFWAVSVTTGVGHDIVPRSVLEVSFSTIMTIVGLMMYSLIIGSASSALANLDSTAAQHRQTLDRVSSYMRSRKVPAFFQRIIKDYYEHMWSTPNKEDDVFEDLPETLRGRLSIVMNRDLVDRMPIFRLMPAEVYIRMVQRLTYNTFLPGEFIINLGESSQYLYFIKRGRVDMITSDTIFKTLHPGESFGQHGVLAGGSVSGTGASLCTFRAVDFVDVLVMTKGDVQELYVTAPPFIHELQRIDGSREACRIDAELELLRAREEKAQQQQEQETSNHETVLEKLGHIAGVNSATVHPSPAGSYRDKGRYEEEKKGEEEDTGEGEGDGEGEGAG